MLDEMRVQRGKLAARHRAKYLAEAQAEAAEEARQRESFVASESLQLGRGPKSSGKPADPLQAPAPSSLGRLASSRI